MIIAIDGPAGAGKTSVSREVARRLGMCMLDTGATYRTCALATVRAGKSPDDPDRVLDAVRRSSIRILDDGRGVSRMELDGLDVTDGLHTPEIDRAVTPVCQVPEVREMMVALQRDFASGHDTVCEGRDMGTVVFPDAEVKVWLTADDETRARRRAEQFGGQDVKGVLTDMRRRDKADAERDISPMVAAEDATVVDTTNLTFEESVDAICRLAESVR